MPHFRCLIFIILFLYNSVAHADFTIYTSIEPLASLVKGVILNKGDVKHIILKNRSIHNYFPSYSDIIAMQFAQLVIYIDDESEPFIKNVRNSHSKSETSEKFIALSKIPSIKLIYNDELNPDKLKNIDPHIFLSPENGIIIIKYIAKILCERDKNNCDYYNNNAQNMIFLINKNINIIREELRKYKDNDYLINHNSIKYFTDFFGLKSPLELHVHHDSQLSPNKLSKISKIVNSKKIKCLLVEKTEETKSMKSLAEKWHLNYTYINVENMTNDSYPDIFMDLKDNLLKCFSK